MRSLRDIPVFENVPVLVRAGLNVPLAGGTIESAYRLRRALPTLTYLAERGARVIVASHLGERGTETFEPLLPLLKKHLDVTFCPEAVGPRAREAARTLPAGSVLLLENLRRMRGETANDLAFARELASLADVFVQDSFDTCHRLHASIVSVPQLLPSYAGLLVEEEVEALSGARTPKHPSLAVIGGAKSATKEVLVKELLARYTHVALGGALANDFLKAQGFEVGKSLVAPEQEGIRAFLSAKNLVLPTDVVLGNRLSGIAEVRASDYIYDIGPASTRAIATLALSAKTVLWNGPLGKFEDGYREATDAVAQAIAAGGARSIVGGGDTIAAIEGLSILPQFSFVSTGGGAMLEHLAKGTLPGIEALG